MIFRAPRRSLLKPSWAILKLCWTQIGPEITQLGPTWPQLAPTWSQHGPNKAQLGPTWPNRAQLGSKLFPKLFNLAPTWPNLVPSWLSQCRPTWPQLASQFVPIWLHFGLHHHSHRILFLSIISFPEGLDTGQKQDCFEFHDFLQV